MHTVTIEDADFIQKGVDTGGLIALEIVTTTVGAGFVFILVIRQVLQTCLDLVLCFLGTEIYTNVPFYIFLIKERLIVWEDVWGF